jgi:UDP-GlcNAc:undecaprenyl-phosphate/decaprenyl-phosphate GlcNAc-1-phosphate transferase
MRELALNCMNGFLLSFVLIQVMQKIASRVGLLDIPTARKNHQGRVPMVGAALFVAFAVSALLLEQRPGGFASFMIGLAALVLLGLLDDRLNLRASVKLVVQIACAALMVLPSQALIWKAGTLFGADFLLQPHWAVPLTIIVMVGLINALNMIDGIDGLAGSLSVVALLWFAVAAGLVGLRGELLLALLVAFCVLGFLIFNLRHHWRSRASVFLGDSGSMMLGAVLAFLAIVLSQRNGADALSPVAALWICAVPIIDTGSLIVRRLAAGTSPFSSDRQHLHHLMIDAGLSVNQVVVTLSITGAVCGAAGVFGWRFGLSDAVMLTALAIPAGLHVWFEQHGRHHLHGTKPRFGHGKSSLKEPQPLLK